MPEPDSKFRDRDILDILHHMDKRVAVVETRISDQDRELRTVHNSIDDIQRDIKMNTTLIKDVGDQFTGRLLELSKDLGWRMNAVLVSLGAIGLVGFALLVTIFGEKR